MAGIVSVIRKHLMSEPIIDNGFKYTFTKISAPDDWSLEFSVNVELPKKGQSYVRETFNLTIEDIIYNLWKYIGISFSFSIVELTVDGLPSYSIYISPEKVSEILESIENRVKHVKINNIEFDIDMVPHRGRSGFYNMDGNNIDFWFDYRVRKLLWKGNPVKIKDHMYDMVGGVISEELSDLDSFRTKIEDIIYLTIEPEIKIKEYDNIYISAFYHLKMIDEVQVFPEVQDEINPDEMFI